MQLVSSGKPGGEFYEIKKVIIDKLINILKNKQHGSKIDKLQASIFLGEPRSILII